MKKTYIAATVVLLVLIGSCTLTAILTRKQEQIAYGTEVFSGDFPNTEFRGVIRQHPKLLLKPADGYYYTLQVWRDDKMLTSFWVSIDSFRAFSFSVETTGDELAFHLEGYTYLCRMDVYSHMGYAIWRATGLDLSYTIRTLQ
jgi:hypothetical protein